MTNTSRNFSQLGILLPSQHSPASRQPLPERRLMAAVLNEALDCLVKYGAATDPKGRRIFAETRRWLLVDEPEWPYSFRSICEVLGLDSGAVLKRLLADRFEAVPASAVAQRPVCGELSWPRSADAAPR